MLYYCFIFFYKRIEPIQYKYFKGVGFFFIFFIVINFYHLNHCYKRYAKLHLPVNLNKNKTTISSMLNTNNNK